MALTMGNTYKIVFEYNDSAVTPADRVLKFTVAAAAADISAAIALVSGATTADLATAGFPSTGTMDEIISAIRVESVDDLVIIGSTP